MPLVADTWHDWGMLEIQEAVQMYDRWEQDNHRAIDMGAHGLRLDGFFLFFLFH